MLADTFYISKYHMKRMFRQETGCTIGDYITSKRLLLARELMARDVSMDPDLLSVRIQKLFHLLPGLPCRYFKEPAGEIPQIYGLGVLFPGA